MPWCKPQQGIAPLAFAKAVPVLSLVHAAAWSCLNLVPQAWLRLLEQALLVRGAAEVVHGCRLSLFSAPPW